jgi:TPR repeat protein
MKAIARWIALTSVLFVSAGSFAVAATENTETTRADVAFWESVRDSKDPSELEAYLKAFPQGRFAPLATIRLKKLRDAAGEQNANPPPAAGAAVPPQKQAEIPSAPPAKLRGWIGAEVRNIDEKRAREFNLAGPTGAEVVSLVSFGPAASSGLKPGDMILSADGEPVLDNAHLIRLISALAPGKGTALAILRGGQRHTVNLKVGNYFDDQWAAAHRNEPIAMINLGNLYADGSLVGKNLPEARKWYERAADAGSALAMRNIAWRYEHGRGFEQNDREALTWYGRAAMAGDVPSMHALGLFNYRGRVVERDLRKAADWYKRAASLGFAPSMQNYGLALFDGTGVEKNEALAVEYFQRAAQLGQPEAFASLAWAHHQGRGTRQDLSEALRLYREAATRGHHDSYYSIAMMYERGEGGLTKNRAEAIRHHRMAAEAGNTNALERLKALKATPYDPAEVQRLLSALGFDPGPRPGRKTEDAIRKFQRSLGLPADGKASLQLVGQLREAMKKKEVAATTAPTPKAGTPPEAPANFEKLRELEKLD